MLLDEGLENVFARHFRIAEGIRKAVQVWDMSLCAKTPDLYFGRVAPRKGLEP